MSRVCLVVPGGDQRKLAASRTAGADEIVLDLEDAVPAATKGTARETAFSWLATADPDARLAVRVNAPRTPWCHDDLLACAASAAVSSIVLPKVESPGDLEFADRLLDGAERATGRTEPLAIQALIETASGLMSLREIVRTSPRLRTLILGYADLAASLGRPDGPPLDTWLPAQHALLTAARSAGLTALDGPYLGTDVAGAFHANLTRARSLGFDGKWVIHPRQVTATGEAFTPTDQELSRARAVLAALDHAARGGAGAAELDGQMIDEASATAARRTLAREPG